MKSAARSASMLCGRLPRKTVAARSLAPMAFAVVASTIGIHGTAQAQALDGSVLVRPAIPEGFDRGRNVSVMERPRPDYDPIGIDVGSFRVLPRVTFGGGYTSNVFLNEDGKSDGYATLQPGVDIRSDWSRHSLNLRAAGVFQRYFSNPRRNLDNFDLGGIGRYDVGSSMSFLAEGQFAQISESPDTGALSPDLTALSRYRRGYVRAQGSYQNGQGRAILAYDRTHLGFNNIELASGGRFDQSDRDRTIDRFTGQIEYATTPSFYVYAQGNYSLIDYDRSLLSGVANRDSKSFRLLGGVSLDLAGLLRGQIGAGYTWRNYDSPIYRNAKGFSVEGKLEYFQNELTTYTLQVARTLEDSSIGATNAFFNTRASFRVDREARRNFIVSAEGQVYRVKYVDIDNSHTVYRLTGSARYLATRRWSLEGRAGYSHRGRSLQSVPYGEFRAEVGLRFSL